MIKVKTIVITTCSLFLFYGLSAQKISKADDKKITDNQQEQSKSSSKGVEVTDQERLKSLATEIQNRIQQYEEQNKDELSKISPAEKAQVDSLKAKVSSMLQQSNINTTLTQDK